MRKWFVILMLLVLPIRGFVGDAMAYSMTPVQIQTYVDLQATAEAPQQEATKMPCHETSGLAQTDVASDVQQCTTCQMCHLTATYPFQAIASLSSTATALPVQYASFWHSAEQRLSVKPPVL